jgi:hypothetical protein
VAPTLMEDVSPGKESRTSFNPSTSGFTTRLSDTDLSRRGPAEGRGPLSLDSAREVGAAGGTVDRGSEAPGVGTIGEARAFSCAEGKGSTGD